MAEPDLLLGSGHSVDLSSPPSLERVEPGYDAISPFPAQLSRLHFHWSVDCLREGFSHSSVGKESTCNTGDLGLIPVWKIPWRRKWQPTPVSLPGKSHGQRSLEGYSPWGRKEVDTI